MIDGFRFGFFGVGDISPWLSLSIVVFSLLVLSIITILMLRAGYKLRG
jgi:ABC-2 type transport system permease protein